MANKRNKSALTTVSALTPEEFQKLTPEEQLAHFNKLNEAHAELAAKNQELVAEVKEAQKAAKADSLPVVEGVEEDTANDIEAGDYEWTAPLFTWDDGNVIDVRELMADAASDEEKVSQKATVIIAKLLQRKSGLLRRKEG